MERPYTTTFEGPVSPVIQIDREGILTFAEKLKEKLVVREPLVSNVDESTTVGWLEWVIVNLIEEVSGATQYPRISVINLSEEHTLPLTNGVKVPVKFE